MRNNQTTHHSNRIWTLLMILAMSCLSGQTVFAQSATTQTGAEKAITFSGTEVLNVTLKKPVVRPDRNGLDRSWSQAYMVRLRITEPPALGPVFELYLDDKKIQEYGGWEEGVYFWVYDREQLQTVSGKTLSYRFARTGKQQTLGRIDIGEQQFRQVREEELRQR